MVSLTILLCFPWAAIAQFGEQRLIPLAAENPKADPLVVVDETIPSQDFVVYGRANEGYPTVAGGTPYTGEGAYNAGILYYVPYQQIPNSQEARTESRTNAGFRGVLWIWWNARTPDT